jgi:S1-C subfamily serine protease
MTAPKRTLYEILGIAPDANAIDVGLAYDGRKEALAKAVPPDASEIALVQQAYEVLSNAKRREAYDASLVTAAEKAAAAEQDVPDLALEPEVEPKAKPVWVGVLAGAVVIVAALYFTFHERRPPPSAPAETVAAPKPIQPAAPPQPLAPAQILAAAASWVGRVVSLDMSGQSNASGLAVAIDRGSFVTTCHGIPAGSQLVVRVAAESHSATLSVTDEALDLCRLTVPDIAGRGMALANEEPAAGSVVYVLGANAKGELALTEGTVKQVRPAPRGNVIEISTPIAPNGSGGPVFDRFGRIVGIATTAHDFGAGLNIALPASWIAQMRSRPKGG